MADYSINAVERKVSFTGSAGLGPYAFSFEILTETDIVVYLNETLLTISTDYSVTINTNGTGSVTLITGGSIATTPTASDLVVIVGARDIERTTDFVTAGDLRAAALNEQLDALTIMVQQVSEEVARAVKAPVYDPTGISMTLPKKADRVNAFIAFDANGDVSAAVPSDDVTTLAEVATDIKNLADIEDGTIATDAISDTAAIASDVTTVAGIAANVTAVANDQADIGTVATDLAGSDTIGTVAANISNVNAVAAIDSDVSAVAADATDIGTVATDLAGSDTIGTVAGIAANVTTVAGISTEVTAVAGDATDIGTVATDLAGSDTIGTVAGSIANVNTVATNIGSVNTAATDINKIIEVANDLQEAVSEIEVVANNISSVQTVGDAVTNVNTVAGLNTEIGLLGTADAVSDMNTLATAAIVADMDALADRATDIATLADIEDGTTATGAISTAAANVADITNFAEVYVGPSATAPTTRSDGSALQVGDLYFDTATDTMKVYTSSGWAAAGSSVNGTSERQNYVVGTPSGSYDGSTTVFPATYDAGFVDVYLNGVKLVVGTDFTATNGTSITLASAATSGDAVNIIGYGTFSLANFSINDANDVSTGGVTDGQVLAYNNSTGDFEPTTISTTPAAVSSQANTATDFFALPSGTTAQRPVSPAAGYIRHNTDDDVVETYNGTTWIAVGDQSVPYSVEYLVIAGGGGGGASSGGGGGAGGYRSSVSGESSGGGASAETPLSLIVGATYTVTVGAGGAGGGVFGTGTNGDDSVFGSITSNGGGGGGYSGANGFSGGSGGGAPLSSGRSVGSGTAGQGFAGGGANRQGGGGAGEAGGTDGVNEGGDGVASSITGTSVVRGGGGGFNIGGDGGGGDPSVSGTANTGGGGGPWSGTGTAGAGGSGVVILRMPTARYSGITTGSPTVTTDGSDTILTYTSSGSYTA